MSRHLYFTFILVAGIGIGATDIVAQTKSPAAKKSPAATEQTAPAPVEKGASEQNVTMPSAESVLIMIRSTLLALGQAIETGNFTVFRDLAGPSFRSANSAGRLYQIFANLMISRVNLSAVAILAPQLLQAPSIDANRRLHIVGYFPGDPIQLKFDLQFEAVANQWRLFGLAVEPVKLSTANGSPDPAGPDGKKDKRASGK